VHRSRSHAAEELSACIHCNECLVACPALHTPITIETLNQETLAAPVSLEVARFARACIQCGACVPVCPAGLHRDAMMLWIKMRLLRGDVGELNMIATAGVASPPDVLAEQADEFYPTARTTPRNYGDSPTLVDDHRRAAPWR